MVGTRRFELRSTGFLTLQKLVIGMGLSKPGSFGFLEPVMMAWLHHVPYFFHIRVLL